MRGDAIFFEDAVTHLQTLRERASYLGKRIEAKQAVGWCVEYDERERAALQWAIDRLARESVQQSVCAED